MKKTSCILLLTVIVYFSCGISEERNEIDLTNYNLEEFDYFPPFDVGVSLFSSGLKSDKAAALGRLLFYDNNLSLNKNVSCGSCHIQSKAFADNKVLSSGLFGDETQRNTQSVAYAGFQGRLFWDGRTRNLESASIEPILNHSEMSMPDIDMLIDRLNETEHYPVFFDEVFNGKIEEGYIGLAIAEFIRSLYNFDAPYDEGFKNDFASFTEEEKKGKEIFEGKGNCMSCHQTHIFGSYYRNTNIGLYNDYKDEGSEKGRFRVPSLRNIELTAPYMHDGSMETLEEVVEHYSTGVKEHDHLDWNLKDWNGNPIRLNLTEDEKSNLVAFLKTLTDNSLVHDEKFSNPYR